MENKLIEFVSKNPILYEKKYRPLRYHDEKKAKWEQISRILRKDPNLVRQKWKHLRDTYLRCYKQKRNKEDDDALSTRTWQHYNAMSFLNSTLVETDYPYKNQENQREFFFDLKPLQSLSSLVKHKLHRRVINDNVKSKQLTVLYVEIA